MDRISELMTIIELLGGSATINEIMTEYSKKYHMIIMNTHLSDMQRILKDNLDYVVYNPKDNKWMLKNRSTVHLNNRQIHCMSDNIRSFNEVLLPKYQKSYFEAINNRDIFLKLYPEDSISSMELDSFLVGSDNKNTFCNLLYNRMQGLCSLGNAYPDMFGIYLKGGSTITLHRTYLNRFSDDFRAAFEDIKETIVNILDAAHNDDIEKIASIKLHSQFKAKLLSVYYLDKFVPVCVRNTLDEYCKVTGVDYDRSDIAYGMKALNDWKYLDCISATWNNYFVMSFCDYYWRKNQK